MEANMVFKVLISLALVGVLGLLGRLYSALVVKSRRLRSILKKQGINGPPQKFLRGNITDIKKYTAAAVNVTSNAEVPPLHHDCETSMLPFFKPWMKKYGDVFLFALGNTQIVLVTRPDLVREITTCTSLDLGKPLYQAKEFGSILGQGILTSNGTIWSHQRKLLAPEFYIDKVKGMNNIITDSTITLLDSWKSRVEAEGGVAEIEIDQPMRSFSGDVISRACFGSNYSKGEEIFSKLASLQKAVSKKLLTHGIPGMRYLPTKSNRETWALEKEVDALILQVVKERNEAGYEEDLLQRLLEATKNCDMNQDEIENFIVSNSKNIYQAGYETTAVSATWCLMLLASNQEWQDRVRSEAVQICKRGQVPNPDMVLKMKQLHMVINESLRLYPPVVVISREALKDMKFANINFPKGVNLWTLVSTLHTDPENWGPDSYKFNPDRFANGITGACKLPHLYMPFGVGPRVCLGQNLALAELKILLSLIVSNFCFTLSPKYVHKPAQSLVLQPGHGVQLLVKKL